MKTDTAIRKLDYTTMSAIAILAAMNANELVYDISLVERVITCVLYVVLGALLTWFVFDRSYRSIPVVGTAELIFGLALLVKGLVVTFIINGLGGGNTAALVLGHIGVLIAGIGSFIYREA